MTSSATDRLTHAHVLVLAGRGRYEDPWHDHAATSARIAELLTGAGARAEVRSTFAHAFTGLQRFDLVVVNAGRGRTDPDFDGDDAAWADAHEALAAHVDGGRPLLGVHQSANTFADSPHWRRLLGGAWVPGTSWHPPQGDTTVDVADPTHQLVAGLEHVRVDDERYCDLVVHPDSHVLLTQHEAGTDHPLVWVAPSGRVVYDALGHDVGSYASPDRASLLVREAAWLLHG